ncbi:MAG: DUF3291 domain-containing protein [Anaerolineae bacterium]|nr:DUF3291 domain-containing protein [Anaerolineae bacterium]
MSSYHLAQANILLPRAALEDPEMADFMANLAPVNALAEQAPGFVWRLKDDSEDATSIQAFDDPRILLNLSVWESIEALFHYTYSGGHLEIFRRQAEFRARLERPHLALWWVPVGHHPSPQETRERLDHLAAHGPTPFAFTFKQRFEAPALESWLAEQTRRPGP